MVNVLAQHIVTDLARIVWRLLHFFRFWSVMFYQRGVRWESMFMVTVS